jgi:hypothetical protein
MKSAIQRWIRSEFFLWTTVLAIALVYANWLWHADTRSAHRAVAGWARRAVACLPGGDAAPRRASQAAAAPRPEAIEVIGRAPSDQLGIAGARRIASKTVDDAGGARQAGPAETRPPTAGALARAATEATSRSPQLTRVSLGSRPKRSAGEVPQAAPVRNPVVGGVAFEDGLRLFWRGDYRRSAEAFRVAAYHAPDDAVSCYFLALCEYHAGARADAEKSLAQATVLEADKPASDLGRLLERVQGPVRTWLEDARRRAGVGPYRPRE